MTIKVTMDRNNVLTGANDVRPTIWVGGLELFENERCIPEKYGIHFSYSGQIAANGVFAAFRQTPALVDIARDRERLCPSATLLNHTNPVLSSTS